MVGSGHDSATSASFIMHALILAAGVGRRMRPLTDVQHKSLLPVAGIPILDRIIDDLHGRDITDITIVTGYMRDELVRHVSGRFPELTVRYIHNERYDTTNNIFSMALAFEVMDFSSDLLLIESDLVFEPAVLDRILASHQENVALVDRYQPGMDGTVVAIGENDLITQVIPPSLQSMGFDFSDKYKTLNIYRFSRAFCATKLRNLLTYYAKIIDDNCYYELILGILIYVQQAEIYAEILAGESWAEVDDPNDLRLAELTFDSSSRYDLLRNNWGGTWGFDVTDFSFIRNMYFPPPAIYSELRYQLPELLQTYGSRQSTLNEKMSWALQRPTEMTHALSGASQCYPWLRAWFGDKQVIIPDPSFGEYSRIFPAAKRYRDDPGGRTVVFDAAAAAEVVVIVNPNNPTGTVINSEEIYSFALERPDRTLIIDESFIEFSSQPSILDLMSDRDTLQNVLVVKSLSKSLGVPGLRLGALLSADSNLADCIERETPIWNLNSVAESLLEIMLKYRPVLEKSFEKSRCDRAQLVQLLNDSPLVSRVFPSGGNFVLVRVASDASGADGMARTLADRFRILVKDVSARINDGHGYWRLAVRRPDEHHRLVAALLELG
jgi:histidinol-phosphate/aromatic aminotransferase/cobyric acid decarboxylase-like protein/choline kinase